METPLISKSPDILSGSPVFYGTDAAGESKSSGS
jgi:uncharacterized protein (DUF433 family)